MAKERIPGMAGLLNELNPLTPAMRAAGAVVGGAEVGANASLAHGVKLPPSSINPEKHPEITPGDKSGVLYGPPSAVPPSPAVPPAPPAAAPALPPAPPPPRATPKARPQAAAPAVPVFNRSAVPDLAPGRTASLSERGRQLLDQRMTELAPQPAAAGAPPNPFPGVGLMGTAAPQAPPDPWQGKAPTMERLSTAEGEKSMNAWIDHIVDSGLSAETVARMKANGELSPAAQDYLGQVMARRIQGAWAGKGTGIANLEEPSAVLRNDRAIMDELYPERTAIPERKPWQEPDPNVDPVGYIQYQIDEVKRKGVYGVDRFGRELNLTHETLATLYQQMAQVSGQQTVLQGQREGFQNQRGIAEIEVEQRRVEAEMRALVDENGNIRNNTTLERVRALDREAESLWRELDRASEERIEGARNRTSRYNARLGAQTQMGIERSQSRDRGLGRGVEREQNQWLREDRARGRDLQEQGDFLDYGASMARKGDIDAQREELYIKHILGPGVVRDTGEKDANGKPVYRMMTYDEMVAGLPGRGGGQQAPPQSVPAPAGPTAEQVERARASGATGWDIRDGRVVFFSVGKDGKYRLVKSD